MWGNKFSGQLLTLALLVLLPLGIICDDATTTASPSTTTTTQPPVPGDPKAEAQNGTEGSRGFFGGFGAFGSMAGGFVPSSGGGGFPSPTGFIPGAGNPGAPAPGRVKQSTAYVVNQGQPQGQGQLYGQVQGQLNGQVQGLGQLQGQGNGGGQVIVKETVYRTDGGQRVDQSQVTGLRLVTTYRDDQGQQYNVYQDDQGRRYTFYVDDQGRRYNVYQDDQGRRLTVYVDDQGRRYNVTQDDSQGQNGGMFGFGGDKYKVRDKKNPWSNSDSSFLTSDKEREGKTAGQNFAYGFKDGTGAVLGASEGGGDLIAQAAGKGKNRVSEDKTFVDPFIDGAIHAGGAAGGTVIDGFGDATGTQELLKPFAYYGGVALGASAGGKAAEVILPAKAAYDGVKTAAVLTDQEKLLGMKGREGMKPQK